jgi:sulfite exporter TauE/SafE
MLELRAAAYETIGRGVMFAVLGIGMTMLGLSYDLALMTRTGAILTTVMAAVLLALADHSRRADHRKTQMWQAVPADKRPPEPHARFASALVLRETYTLFAVHSAIASGALWTVTLILKIVPRAFGH